MVTLTNNGKWKAREANQSSISMGKEGHAPLAKKMLKGPGKGSIWNRESFGYVALFGTALLWGSWTPSLRLLYQVEVPPDPPLLNALQAVLSAFFLITANLASSSSARGGEAEHIAPLLHEDADGKVALICDPETGGYSVAAAAHAGSEEAPWRSPRSCIDRALASALNWRSTSLGVAGSEVGLWMCLAFGLEVAGVQLTSATKTAFLNQVSMLITPLLVYASGHEVRFVEWLACGLGLLGSGLVAVDAMNSSGGEIDEEEVNANSQMGTSSEMVGLLLIMASAFFFALATVRLGRYSMLFDSLKLSTASACSLSVVSVVWVLCSSLGTPGGLAKEFAVVRFLMLNSFTLMVLLWLGFGPGALAAFLQASGQKVVPAAQAQVIYSTTPLWSAAFAMLILDASDEAMGAVAWLGAAIMLGSSILVAVSSQPGKSIHH
mmetsp:Transcript_22054/g.61065  ORF Transcript_22054/g.61065 Transcript_22054/m.61065 type:complete len:436 (+) Transcript_22054:85-1392(+)